MEKKRPKFKFAKFHPPPKIPHGQIFVGSQDIDAFFFLITLYYTYIQMIFHQEIDPFAKKKIKFQICQIFHDTFQEEVSSPARNIQESFFLIKIIEKVFSLEKKDTNLPDFGKKN